MNKVMVGIVWNDKQKDKLPILYKCINQLEDISLVVVYDDSQKVYTNDFRSNIREDIIVDYLKDDTSNLVTIQEKTVKGRNAIREHFLALKQYTHMFWLDGDVLCPPRTITRLLNSHKDNITAVKPMHGDLPCIFPFNENLAKDFYLKHNFPNFKLVPWTWLCPSRVEEISCYGFGQNLISREATQSCEFWCKPYSPVTEDIIYCMDLQVQGFPIYVDTSILCAHYYSEMKRPDDRFDFGGNWDNLDQHRKHTIQWRNKK